MVSNPYMIFNYNVPRSIDKSSITKNRMPVISKHSYLRSKHTVITYIKRRVFIYVYYAIVA